jgi:hypothetical protein
MKFILSKQHVANSWNGNKSLPPEIHVISNQQQLAEFELLGIICTLHGHVTAFDISIGCEPNTEKDRDITSIMTAFHSYIAPRMPLSHYDANDKRITPPLKNTQSLTYDI